MEKVWSCQQRIFVFNKNAISVFRSSLDHCLLSTALLSRQRTVTIAPQITSFSMIRKDASHDKAVQLKGIHVQKQRKKGECDSWHCETAVRTKDPLMYSIIVNEAVLSYQYFSTVRWINTENLCWSWNLQNCFHFCWPGKPTKMKSIFVGDRLSVGGQQKWNQNCFCFYKEGESHKNGFIAE